MNWKDKTIFIGDNLHIMRGMNSDSVDLIYLDPPFNSNRNYAAPIGSQAAGAAFKDTWTLSDIDDTRARSREGHRRPRGHQSQLRHCPPLVSETGGINDRPRIAINN